MHVLIDAGGTIFEQSAAVQTRVTVFDEARYPVLKAEVLDRLSRSYSAVEFLLNQEQGSGQAYYAGVRFQIYARDQAGTEYFLVDGGLRIGPGNCPATARNGS